MLENKKRVFWEALILTVLIFVLGFLIGILFEDKRVDIIQDYYVASENSLMDVIALNNFASLNNISCDALINSNVDFANRIYWEAKTLEDYEDSGKITDNMATEHKKYDIMRTFLWINTMKTDEICENDVHTVVYVYNYDTDELTEKALNGVWSKILNDLKGSYGDGVILIPVAVDSGVTSLQSILDNFEISTYPVLIIDNEYVLEELTSVEDIEGYFS